MKSNRKKLYKFHFKMDAEMTEKLEKAPLFNKAGNLSKLIDKILMMLAPAIERKHLKGKQMLSKYQLVHENLNIKRKSVFVYLPDYRYRQLKLLHQDLNFYSIAQLLRLMLGVFLDFVAEFGDEVEQKLMLLYRKWKVKRADRKYKWKPIEELLHFIYLKPQYSLFLTLYNKKFQPISIYKL